MKTKQQIPESVKKGGISYFFKMLGSRIIGLFEPEEVEVTFKHKGNKMTYTYTKVEHKQVA